MFFFYLQSLNKIIILKEMPIPQTCVAVAKFGYRCRPFWLLAFKCVNHIPHCLTKDLSVESSLGNPSCTSTTHTKDTHLDNHKPVDIPFAVWSKMKTVDLSLIYWLSKLYKCATKQPYVTGFLKIRYTISLPVTHIYYTSGENRNSRCDINQMSRTLFICLRTSNQCLFLHVA